MTTSFLDAQVRLDTHPTHPSAVTATLTGTQHRTAHALLAARGFESVDERTLVLARIDHEEPYWAQQTARELAGEGVAAEITPRLRDAIDEEWTWANYPMHWCTREEIREVSDRANTLYEDIRRGRLVIHAHAEDGGTTVAVGTYCNGTSVYLHGENHLRQIADTFDSPAQAITAFERFHGTTTRPGPAPATETEQQTAEAFTSLATPAPDGNPTPPAEPEPPRTELVPAYAGDPGDHEALLDAFLDEQGNWQKYRTWVENTIIATHESLTLRIEFAYEAYVNDVAWTIAAYESPTGPRVWHLTATSATPAGIMEILLDSLATQDAWAQEADGLNEQTVAQAMRPLADEGWSQTVNSGWIRWSEPNGKPAGVVFDASAANTLAASPLPAWTIWGGNHRENPTWAIRCSPHTPAELLADLTYDLIHGEVRQQLSPPAPARPPHHATQATAPASAAPPRPHARRTR
ncbi:DUF317 domain-containing protein [Streptomyces sp. JV176]|uniref:DUF317 domain-containing protein n=1 Tax=Streptomyces sp. JV176 TaxID=858630 RepID=UPI002E7994AD|nr:DUF317 domain-containing protein [Streptomyces sp. JV176]MEE1797417.1 DUF317 domain-containing protein [Streptomyces sp. JV176]